MGLRGEERAGGMNLSEEFVTPNDSKKREVDFLFGVVGVTMRNSLLTNLVCGFGHLDGHSDLFFPS
jgi:hypothetical protein